MFVVLNQIGGLTCLKGKFSRISDETGDRQMWSSMIRDNSVFSRKKEDIEFRQSTEKIRTSTLFDTLMVSVNDGRRLYDVMYRDIRQTVPRPSFNTQAMCCTRCGLRVNPKLNTGIS
jgi:hypothetical protein